MLLIYLVLNCPPVGLAQEQEMLSAYQFGISPLVVPSSVPVGTVVAVTRVPVGAELPDCLRSALGVCQLRMRGPEMLATNIDGLSVRVDAVERQTDELSWEPDEADFQRYHGRIRTAMIGGYRIALVKTGTISGGFLNAVSGDFIFEYQRLVPSGSGMQSVFTERLRYRGLKPVRVENDSGISVCPEECASGRISSFYDDRAHRV